MANEGQPAVESRSAVVERFIEEVWNQGNLEAADELVAEDVFYHEPMSTIRGRELYKEYVQTFRTSFPDTRFTMNDLVVEGDKVALRWTFEGSHKQLYPGLPLPAMGRSIKTTGITIYHIEEGQIKALWLETDYSPVIRGVFSAVAVLAGAAMALAVTVGVVLRFLSRE